MPSNKQKIQSFIKHSQVFRLKGKDFRAIWEKEIIPNISEEQLSDVIPLLEELEEKYQTFCEEYTQKTQKYIHIFQKISSLLGTETRKQNETNEKNREKKQLEELEKELRNI
jgi:hypothetical protein